MEKVSKIEKVTLKVIEKARFVMMTTFAGMFGFIALAALIAMFRHFDIINLIGIIAAYTCMKLCWEERR